jgi:ABC-type sugar transport system ATPase subunit
VLALDNVSVDVTEARSTPYVATGQKSTLGKILAGIYRADAGEVH